MPVWIANSKKLRDWLRKDGLKKLAIAPGFAFEANIFEIAKTEVVRQHPEETDPDLRTAYRLLTRPKPKPKVEPGVTRIELPAFLPKWLRVGFGILVLALLSVIAARSQTVIIQDEGTTKIRRAGGQVGANFIGAGVSCGTAVAGIVPCTITGSGGADSITINGVATADVEFDDADPAAPANGFNIKWQLSAAPTPDSVSAYFDTTTMATSTWGSGSAITLTWNVGATDPVVAYTSGNIKWSGATTYTFEGGATDPVWTPGNNQMDLSTGALLEGGNAVVNLTESPTWTGLHTFVPSGLGGLANFDIQIGDTDGAPTYGIGRFGNSIFGRTSFIAGSLDLDGAVLSQNAGGPVTSTIEFAWMESGTSIRFAIPTSGADLGTYSPRSLIIAGPAPANSNMVNCDTWTTDNTNIDCNTATTGADLFVQDDAEIEGTVFAGVLLEGGNPVPNDTDGLNFFAATTVAELAGVLSDENFTPGSEASAEGVLDLPDLQGQVAAGQYAAGSIDGDDLASGLAGTGLTLTPASPDTLDCDAASTTAVGCPEMAIASEVDTGTSTILAVTPDALAGSTFGQAEVQMVLFDFTTAVATGDGAFYFHIATGSKFIGMNLIDVVGAVITVSSSGAIDVDVARCAPVATGNPCSGTVADALSTNLTIDQNEDSSNTAATPSVVDTSLDDVIVDQTWRVDVDGAGTGTQGLIVTLIFQKP